MDQFSHGSNFTDGEFSKNFMDCVSRLFNLLILCLDIYCADTRLEITKNNKLKNLQSMVYPKP